MICVSEHELETILDILEKHAPDCEARVFGSRYKWTSSEYSDLDIALAGKAKLGFSRLVRISDAFEESELPFRVDVLDWRCLSKEFQSIINNGHEVIYTPQKRKKENWQKVRLGDVCDYYSGRISTSNLTVNNYISTENILPNKSGITISSGLPATQFVSEYQKDTVLVSNIRPYFRKIWYAAQNGGCSNDILVFKAKKDCYPKFLYYLLSENRFFDYSMLTSKGTKMPRGDRTAIMRYPVPNISYEKQCAIAATLSCLDDKITLNSRINANLEAQAQAIFKSWFVDFEPWGGVMPRNWKNGTLNDVANITTGKRPPYCNPIDSAKANIPVIGASSIMGYTNVVLYDEKILITGRVGTHGVIQRYSLPCWASDNTLVIKSGFYEFTYQQLCNVDFRNMNRGSTQPLITQTDLKKAPILIPDESTLREFEELAGSLMGRHIANILESVRLAAIRDALLPKLMSGEVEVGV